VQGGAHSKGGVGINGAVAFVDQLDDALFVDDNIGAQSPFVGFVLDVVTLEDAVGLQHLAVHVAEEGEGDADLLGESGVGSGTIERDSKNFRIRGIDFTGGDSSLDRLKLFRSTAGEGQDVDGEENVLFAAVVAELDGFPAVAEEGEVRGDVTNLEGHFRHLGLFGLRQNRSSGESGGDQNAQRDGAFHQEPPRLG